MHYRSFDFNVGQNIASQFGQMLCMAAPSHDREHSEQHPLCPKTALCAVSRPDPNSERFGP